MECLPDNTDDVGWNTFVALEGSARFLQLYVAARAGDKWPSILLEDSNNPSFTEEIHFLCLKEKINLQFAAAILKL